MPKVPTEIRSLARSHSRTAIKTLANIMINRKAPAAAQVTAAGMLLDRGWGKPDQTITADVSGVFLDVLRELNRVRLAAPGDDAKVIDHINGGVDDDEPTTAG